MIRAAAFKDGYTPTNVDTQTYFFLDDVILQDGSDVPASATWGHDKEDDEPGMNPELAVTTRSGRQRLGHGSRHRTAVGDAQLKNDLKSIPTMSIVMNWDDLFSGTPQPGSPPQTGTLPASSSAVAPNPQGIYIMGRSDERYTSLEYINPNLPNDQFQIDAADRDSRPFEPDALELRQALAPGEIQDSVRTDRSSNYPFFAGSPDGENATGEFDTLILDAMFQLLVDSREYRGAIELCQVRDGPGGGRPAEFGRAAAATHRTASTSTSTSTACIGASTTSTSGRTTRLPRNTMAATKTTITSSSTPTTIIDSRIHLGRRRRHRGEQRI